MQAALNHYTSPRFWDCYEALPQHVRKLADANFELLKQNPRHPSLHVKQTGQYWSVRVGLRYRALGVSVPDGIVWFWIGTHTEYDRLIS
jgi:hypothetical protein